MRRGILGLTAVCLLLGLCGCGVTGGDLDGLLRAPRLTGEQAAVQQALDRCIAGDYVLKYPQSGDYRAALILRDMDGDGQEEAVCFYCLPEENTHVLLLRQQEGAWEPLSDIQGTSTEIDWVTFGDMRGDGHNQLLVGWSIYNNSRDRSVLLYELSQGQLMPLLTEECAAVCLGPVTNDRRDSLLLFRIDSARSTVTAELMELQEEGLTQLASARMDGYIQAFGTPRLVALGEGLNGVFVDGYKDANSTITDLIYWDGGRLNVPFYDAGTNTNTATAREALRTSTLTAMDVNGDGVWEWPQNRRLVGYQTTDIRETHFLTTWMYFDLHTGQAVKAFESLVNPTDGYLLMLEPGLMGETADTDRLSMRYDAASHLLELQEVTAGVIGDTLLRIAPVSRELEFDDGWPATTVTLSDNAVYTVWYRPEGTLVFTPEQIRYMLTALP